MIIDTPQGPIEFPDDTPQKVIEQQIAAMQDTYEGQDEGAGNVMQQALQGATFNLADEGMATAAAGTVKVVDTFNRIFDSLTGKKDTSMFGKYEERGFGELYEEGRDELRSDMRKYQRENPKTAMAAQLAGGLATGIASGSKILGSQMVKQGSNMVKALSVPTLAAAEGAAYGFGEGEGFKESVLNMPASAATSAIVGTTLNKLMRFGGKRLLKNQAKHLQQVDQPDQTIKHLRDQAKMFYQTADESGVKLKAAAYEKWQRGVLSDFKAENIKGNIYPRISGAIREIKALKNPTYNELEGIKILLKRGRIDNDNATREIANELSTRVDDLIANLKPDHITKGNLENLGPHLKKARDLWHRKAQAEVLEEIQEKALLSEQVIDAGDYDKAVRGGIRQLIGNQKRVRGMDEDVVTDLHEIIVGGKVKKLQRMMAGIAPGSHTHRGLMPTVASAGAGFTAGGVPGATIGATLPSLVGGAFKKFAGVASNKELTAIKNAILNRNQKKLKDIVEALTEKYGDRIGGAAAGISGVTASTLNDMMSDNLSP